MRLILYIQCGFIQETRFIYRKLRKSFLINVAECLIMARKPCNSLLTFRTHLNYLIASTQVASAVGKKDTYLSIRHVINRYELDHWWFSPLLGGYSSLTLKKRHSVSKHQKQSLINKWEFTKQMFFFLNIRIKSIIVLILEYLLKGGSFLFVYIGVNPNIYFFFRYS